MAIIFISLLSFVRDLVIEINYRSYGDGAPDDESPRKTLCHPVAPHSVPSPKMAEEEKGVFHHRGGDVASPETLAAAATDLVRKTASLVAEALAAGEPHCVILDQGPLQNVQLRLSSVRRLLKSGYRGATPKGECFEEEEYRQARRLWSQVPGRRVRVVDLVVCDIERKSQRQGLCTLLIKELLLAMSGHAGLGDCHVCFLDASTDAALAFINKHIASGFMSAIWKLEPEGHCSAITTLSAAEFKKSKS